MSTKKKSIKRSPTDATPSSSVPSTPSSAKTVTNQTQNQSAKKAAKQTVTSSTSVATSPASTPLPIPAAAMKKEKKVATSSSAAPSSTLRGGFKTLPIAISESDNSLEHARFLYYKKHTPKSDQPSSSTNDDGEEDTHHRTLFVINVPFNWTFEELGEVFGVFGSVDGVIFLDEGPPVAGRPAAIPTRSAHVVFESAESCDAALRADTTSVQPYTRGSIPTGVTKWLSDYKRARPDVEQLQTVVDRFMVNFDQRVAEEKTSRIEGAKPDAEGWIKVVNKHTKKKKLPRVDPETEARAKRKADKKQHIVDSVHFYRHREREQKEKDLAALRTKFAEDKKRIELMRAQRKFKPY